MSCSWPWLWLAVSMINAMGVDSRSECHAVDSSPGLIQSPLLLGFPGIHARSPVLILGLSDSRPIVVMHILSAVSQAVDWPSARCMDVRFKCLLSIPPGTTDPWFIDCRDIPAQTAMSIVRADQCRTIKTPSLILDFWRNRNLGCVLFFTWPVPRHRHLHVSIQSPAIVGRRYRKNQLCIYRHTLKLFGGRGNVKKFIGKCHIDSLFLLTCFRPRYWSFSLCEGKVIPLAKPSRIGVEFLVPAMNCSGESPLAILFEKNAGR